MFCKLKEVAAIPPDALTTIRRFFSEEGREAVPTSSSTATNRKAKHTTASSTVKSLLPVPMDTDPQQLLPLTDDDSQDDECASQAALDDFPQWSSSDASQHNNPEEDTRWLKSSLVAASPNFDMLAISAFERFILLEQSPISKGRWELIATVQIPKPKPSSDTTSPAPDFYITSLILLPMGSTHRTSASHIDWTCVCVGLNTGQLLFYTERGTLVFSEQFSHSSIKAIRFGPSIYPGKEELVVLAPKGRAIVVEGLSLYTTLKAAKNQVARGERTVEEISSALQLNTHSLQLDHLRHVHDIQPVGPTKPSTFDQYVSAARSGAGKYARISSSTLPLYGSYLCCSTSPRERFASFVWNDGSSTATALITDAIYSLTSQITNQIQLPSFGIRSWLGVGTSRRDQPAPPEHNNKKESAIDGRVSTVSVRSSIADEGRVGERCYVAPNGWPLVAVADANARVLLIHSRSRQIIRIWKGYRSARCGWLEAGCVSSGDGEGNLVMGSPGRRRTRTLFLAIYAPRRGLLEVWSAPNGPRVSAFKVSPNGRLLTAIEGVLMGSGGGDSSAPSSTNTVAFLDPSGRVLALSAPFHLSAMDASASAVHDENLLKELELDECPRMAEVFQKLRTNAAKRKLLGSIIETEGERVEEVLVVLMQLEVRGEDPQLLEHIKLLNHLAGIHRLLTRENIATGDAQEEEEADYAQMRDLFRMEKEEFDDLNLPLMRSHSVMKEEGSVRPSGSLKELVGAVEALSSQHQQQHQQEEKNAYLGVLGHLLFGPFILSDRDTDELFSKVIPLLSPYLPPLCLAEAFVIFWLGSNANSGACPQHRVGKALQILRKLIEMDITPNEKGLLQPFANRVMSEHIFKSSHLQSALLLCCMLRTVRTDIKDPERDGGLFIKRIKLEQPKEEEEEEPLAADDPPPVEDDEKFLVFDEAAAEESANWTSLDEEVDWWELVSRHLAALALVQLLPSPSPASGDLSLLRLSQKGYGFYREQLGAWAAKYSPPCPRSLAYVLSGKEIPIGETDTLVKALPPRVCEVLSALCTQFPMSLRAELVLSDCCWEAASSWFKDESRRVEKLQLAVDFLDLLQPAPRLQHGLALMMWDTFLRPTSEKLVELLEEKNNESSRGGGDHERVGGSTLLAHKDRLLRRDVLVVEKDLLGYVACVRSVLKLLAHSVSQLTSTSANAKSYPHFYEDFLERFFLNGRNGGADPRHTLTELATRYKPVNYHLVLHHIHLLAVVDLELGLHIRLRLSALFDPVGRRALFEAFHSHPLIPLAQVDDRTRGRRQKFLEKVVEQICTTQSSQHYHELGQSREWKLALELAKDWQLDVDTLRVKEISKLYEWGLDKEAERLIPNVQNRHMLLAAIVPVIGGRVQSLIEEDGRLPLKVCQCSAASESTLSYLKQVGVGAAAVAVPDGSDCQRIRSMIRQANRLVTALSNRKKGSEEGKETGVAVWDLGTAFRLLKEMEDVCKVAEAMPPPQPNE